MEPVGRTENNQEVKRPEESSKARDTREQDRMEEERVAEEQARRDAQAQAQGGTSRGVA